MWRHLRIALSLVAVWATGCAGLHTRTPCQPAPSGCGSCDAAGGDDKKCDYDCEAKTLFKWAVCKEKDDDKKDDDKDDKKDDDKDDKKDGDKKDADKDGDGKEKEPKKDGDAKAAPNGKVGYVRLANGGVTPAQMTVPVPMPAPSGEVPAVSGRVEGATRTLTGTGLRRFGSAGTRAESEDDSIVTDRPDFTEASSTVGRGRIQLESGYTYVQDTAGGVRTRLHSYPEMLLRVGMFADWFELRVGQNFNSTRVSEGGADTTLTGANDLYVGTKLGLVEQKGIFPELALILQATVPTGHQALTSNQFLPGVSLLYSWELNDKWSLAGSVLGNKTIDDEGRAYLLMASSVSLGYSFTDKLGSYFEYFGFYPSGAVASGVKPEYYLNGGFTYKVTKNFQLDIRAGFGLNEAADDFFSGIGFAVRY